MENQTEKLSYVEQVKQLYKEDQGDRVKFAKKEITGLEVYQRDEDRLKKAKEILNEKKVFDQFGKDELDMFAFIFMHGNTINDYEQALTLATKSVEMGFDPKQSLIPQATDRLMIQEQLDKGIGLLELKQKYGTQTRYDDTSKLFKPSLDGTITKEEFEKFGIEQL